jgi:hypothetical protein
MQSGTDNEAYGQAVYKLYGKYSIGCVQAALNFCPWCGKRINPPNPSDQRAGEAPVQPVVGRVQDNPDTTKKEK